MSLTPPLTGNEDLDSFLYNIADNITGNATPQNTVVYNDDGSVSYLYRYLHVKFADDGAGTNFSNSQVNRSYYGLLNSPLLTESNNPADYTWFKTNGFGNDYKFWYKLLGGRKIEITISILKPNDDPKYIFDNNSPAIDLDSIRVEGVEIVDTQETVGQLLDILTTEITESQLFQDLGDRINLIDADNTLANSVNYRILQETNARASAILEEATAREAAITLEQTTRQTEDESLASSITLLTASVNNNASAISTEQTARADADTALASSITTLASTVNGNTSAISTEQTTRADADTTLASSITALTSTVDNNTSTIVTEATTRADADTALASDISLLAVTVGTNSAAIVTEQTARADADTALASDISTLFTSVGDNLAAISAEQTARAGADSALASDITTLQSTVGDNTVAIQTEATTRATETGDLFGKYSVKIDNNGYVSGFGLLSTANNSTPFSQFIVRADNFAIASPAGPSITPSVPFNVYTTTQNITTPSGAVVTVDPGVYIKNASIEYVTADQIDTRGLSIKDNSGNIIFASGTALDPSYINVPSTWDTTTNTAAAISGQGIFATAPKLTNANISTYISDLAVGNAQIANLAVNNAKIADLSVSTLKIQDQAVSTMSTWNSDVVDSTYFGMVDLYGMAGKGNVTIIVAIFPLGSFPDNCEILFEFFNDNYGSTPFQTFTRSGVLAGAGLTFSFTVSHETADVYLARTVLTFTNVGYNGIGQRGAIARWVNFRTYK